MAGTSPAMTAAAHSVSSRGPELVTIPGLQRIIPLRFMLRCARETFDLRASLPG